MLLAVLLWLCRDRPKNERAAEMSGCGYFVGFEFDRSGMKVDFEF
jgi:UDP:flavonoid glycosyltransferase YjiC (YdhE family)